MRKFCTERFSTNSTSHFGHNQQAVIHQGICYSSQFDPVSFVTYLSYDSRKTAPAIQAHLKPIVDYFTGKFDSLSKVIILSDGPSSQYRNRFTVTAVDTLMKQVGVRDWCWVFSESGHGKGPSDGVGSAVKRGCDSDVARGCPIRTIQDIRNTLDNRDSKVLNHAVTTDAIDECENILKDITVPKIPGIAETHFNRVANDSIRYSNLYYTQCNPAWSPCA